MDAEIEPMKSEAGPLEAAYAELLAELVAQKSPAAVLLPSTAEGKEVGREAQVDHDFRDPFAQCVVKRSQARRKVRGAIETHKKESEPWT